VNSWATVFLGVIAVSMLATSVIQIAVILIAGRAARRIYKLVERIDREMTPLFGHLNAIGRDAARAASLATAQVERVDRLFDDAGRRIDERLHSIQETFTGPLRDGAALMAAGKAVFGLVRDLRKARAGARAEDEDALFI
jgi:hypothetical protein